MTGSEIPSSRARRDDAQAYDTGGEGGGPRLEHLFCCGLFNAVYDAVACTRRLTRALTSTHHAHRRAARAQQPPPDLVVHRRRRQRLRPRSRRGFAAPPPPCDDRVRHAPQSSFAASSSALVEFLRTASCDAATRPLLETNGGSTIPFSRGEVHSCPLMSSKPESRKPRRRGCVIRRRSGGCAPSSPHQSPRALALRLLRLHVADRDSSIPFRTRDLSTSNESSMLAFLAHALDQARGHTTTARSTSRASPTFATQRARSSRARSATTGVLEHVALSKSGPRGAHELAARPTRRVRRRRRHRRRGALRRRHRRA